MSGKRFKGRLCAYCCQRPSVTGDHVFAREFFTEDARTNLPQAPTCDACNNVKSRLEHYLTTVLPFGGRHANAHESLVRQVPGRLAKNLRLARDMHAGVGRVWHAKDRLFRPAMTVPVDIERMASLFSQIGRGLAWYHFNVYLQSEQTSQALFLSRAGVEFFDRIFQMNAAKRVAQDLGRGTVKYTGVQAVDTPQLTLWRMSFYGGLQLGGDPKQPGEISTKVGVVTGPMGLVNSLTDQTQ